MGFSSSGAGGRQSVGHRARLARGVARVTIAAIATALVVTLPIVPAQARPDTVAKAKAEVERLTVEAAAIDQDYAAAQEKLTSANKVLKSRTTDMKKQAAKVAQMRTQAGRIALAHYQARDVDPTTQLLFSSDPASFMNRYATVEQVTANQNGKLQDFQTQQADLTQMRHDAESQKVDIAAKKVKLQKLRKSSDDLVLEAEAVLSKLTAEERARLKAQEEREAKAAAARAEAADTSAATTDNTDTSTETTDDANTADPKPEKKAASKQASRSSKRTEPATGRSGGASALSFARAQKGKPYDYGATGPNSFDCSGLTGAAWRAAGVSLPRTSQAQFGAGRPVSKDALKPGDLVFYYPGISHVGLYAGNGMILHASRPGKPIGYAPVDSMPYAGARRVG